jgi:hypothetical protein
MRQSKEVFAAILKRGMPALGNEGEWWRGSKEHHAFLPLETLVACARVSKAWHAALVEKGFDYGVAVLGISLARWRVKNVAGGPCDDVDAPAELSKRLSIRMQSETMASGQRLREVRQFLCRHAELSQKNATCREDASAKAFLPALFQGESWQQIFNPAFWLSLTAVEPSGSYLSDGVKVRRIQIYCWPSLGPLLCFACILHTRALTCRKAQRELIRRRDAGNDVGLLHPCQLAQRIPRRPRSL